MIVSGKKLAIEKLRKIKQKIKKEELNLQLDILYIEKNQASELFIKKKQETTRIIVRIPFRIMSLCYLSPSLAQKQGLLSDERIELAS